MIKTEHVGTAKIHCSFPLHLFKGAMEVDVWKERWELFEEWSGEDAEGKFFLVRDGEFKTGDPVEVYISRQKTKEGWIDKMILMPALKETKEWLCMAQGEFHQGITMRWDSRLTGDYSWRYEYVLKSHRAHTMAGTRVWFFISRGRVKVVREGDVTSTTNIL